MATYTITGHPLNINDLAATPGATVDTNLAAALRNNGVGSSITLTLAAGDATKATGHNCIK